MVSDRRGLPVLGREGGRENSKKQDKNVRVAFFHACLYEDAGVEDVLTAAPPTLHRFRQPLGSETTTSALLTTRIASPKTGKKDLLSELFPLAPKLAWIHSRSAGVDSALFPALIEADSVSLTNARYVV